MKFTSLTVTAAVIGSLAAATCFAQTPNPPASTTNPSTASSPSQRDATRGPAADTPETPASQPSDASTPHQRQAMGGKNLTMKECMDARAKSNPDMSKSDMTKACDEQMKMQKEHTHRAAAPSDSTQTPARN